MLYVAKLHAYAVLHVCECKDKARQSKNKRFQFLWQYVAGVCRLQMIVISDANIAMQVEATTR